MPDIALFALYPFCYRHYRCSIRSNSNQHHDDIERGPCHTRLLGASDHILVATGIASTSIVFVVQINTLCNLYLRLSLREYMDTGCSLLFICVLLCRPSNRNRSEIHPYDTQFEEFT